jgi:hypothetical protein
MRDLPQESHADLGLVPDSDHTPDMRRAPAATEALQKNDNPNTYLKGQS